MSSQNLYKKQEKYDLSRKYFKLAKEKGLGADEKILRKLKLDYFN